MNKIALSVSQVYPVDNYSGFKTKLSFSNALYKSKKVNSCFLRTNDISSKYNCLKGCVSWY